LAVELAVSMKHNPDTVGLSYGLAVAFIAVSMFFVWRSFYGMRIKVEGGH